MPNLGTRKSHTTRGYEWVLYYRKGPLQKFRDEGNGGKKRARSFNDGRSPFPDSKLNAPVGRSGDYTLAELSQKKMSAMKLILVQVNKIAIPWSFMAVTPDSSDQPIQVTNTCAYDTVLMALSLLRQYDTDMAFFIKAEGRLITTVLDNIDQNLHVQSRVAWIHHCDTYVPTSNKYNLGAVNIVNKITNNKQSRQGY